MTATERNSALEEAAKVCDKEIERLQAYRHHGFWAVSDCAVLIRALKSAAPEEHSDSEALASELEKLNNEASATLQTQIRDEIWADLRITVQNNLPAICAALRAARKP